MKDFYSGTDGVSLNFTSVHFTKNNQSKKVSNKFAATDQRANWV